MKEMLMYIILNVHCSTGAYVCCRTDVYFYVLDKDGNLVNASTVAERLRAAYSDRQAALFKKYDVIDGDPRTAVSICQPIGCRCNITLHLQPINNVTRR